MLSVQDECSCCFWCGKVSLPGRRQNRRAERVVGVVSEMKNASVQRHNLDVAGSSACGVRMDATAWGWEGAVENGNTKH